MSWKCKQRLSRSDSGSAGGSEVVCGRGPTMEIWWWTQSVGRSRSAQAKYFWKEVSQEEQMRQHWGRGRRRAQSSIQTALYFFNNKTPNAAQQNSRRFQPPEKPLVKSHSAFNRISMPGIQSHLVREEKTSAGLGSRCCYFILHLVPLTETTTSTPIVLLTYLV